MCIYILTWTKLYMLLCTVLGGRAVYIGEFAVVIVRARVFRYV